MLKGKELISVLVVNGVAAIGTTIGTVIVSRTVQQFDSPYKRANFKRKIKSIFKKKEKIEEEKVLKFKCSED